jgi:mannitol-specific phosphotransferase system IIBC component
MISNPIKFASRPIRIALAMKIAFCCLVADASLAAASALLVKGQESAIAATVSTQNVTSAAEQSAKQASLLQDDSAKHDCREVIVEIDEGYGVSSQVTRRVCRKAL